MISKEKIEHTFNSPEGQRATNEKILKMVEERLKALVKSNNKRMKRKRDKRNDS